jgi:RNA polymerase sigma factor (sigma-70 family)
VVLAIIEGIQNNRFTDTAPASFAKWVYTICKNICINANRKALKVKTFSEVFPAEDRSPDPSGLTEEFDIPAPYEDRRAEAERIIAKLSPKDQKLLRLRIKENKSYEEIQLDDDFKRYSVDYLMKMMYKINIKINKIKEALYGKKE